MKITDDVQAASDDSDVDEEQFYKKLEAEAKGDNVDLEKMTRRQRMAYLAQQPNAEVDHVVTNEINLQELNENVFFALAHIKKKDKADKPNKSKLTDSQRDEKKRQDLTKILEEQQKKIKDREKKLKAQPSGNLDGKLIGN